MYYQNLNSIKKFALCILFALLGHTIAKAQSSGESPWANEYLTDQHGTIYYLENYGKIHNRILNECMKIKPQEALTTSCLLDGYIDSLIWKLTQPIELMYLSQDDSNCDENESNPINDWLKAQEVEKATTIRNYFTNSLSTLFNYEIISLEEKQLLLDFYSDLEKKKPIDYKLFYDRWSKGPKKANGKVSAQLMIIGKYSNDFWTNNGGINQYYLLPVLDLCGGAWGVGSYIYSNWSHHYESDFGLKFLSSGGSEALKTSAMAGVKKFIGF